MRRYKILLALFLLLLTAGILYLRQYRHIHQYDSMILRISSRYNLDPDLVWAVIYEESYFERNARSNVGAKGLMQITPIIVREWTRVTHQYDLNKTFPNKNEHRSNIASPLTEAELLAYPEINIQLGCWYLDQLKKRYEELADPLPVMLASYNAGPSNAQRWQDSLTTKQPKNKEFSDAYLQRIDFPETRRYVRSILARYQNHKELSSDTTVKIYLHE